MSSTVLGIGFYDVESARVLAPDAAQLTMPSDDDGKRSKSADPDGNEFDPVP